MKVIIHKEDNLENFYLVASDGELLGHVAFAVDAFTDTMSDENARIYRLDLAKRNKLTRTLIRRVRMFLNHSIEQDKDSPYTQSYTFVVCHKPFEDKFGDISNKVYLTDFKDFAKSSGAVLVDSVYDSKVFGEITFWDYIYKTIRDDDFACLCAYRRKIYPRIGIQVAQPIKFPCSVLQHLSYFHSNILTDALTKALPREELEILNSNIFVPYNIFSAPRQVIGDWLGFVIPRVMQTMQILGCPQDIEGVKDWVKSTDLISPAQGKKTGIDYQARIGAFLSERINTIFWLTRNYGQQFQEVKLLESNQRI